MAHIRHPMIDLVMNDETSRYVGHLERKVMHLTLEDMRMRALLELLTGDMWDDQDFRQMEDHQIQQVAVDTLKRRLNMSEGDARRLVADRWNRLNHPEQDLAPAHLFGPKANEHPHNVTIARPAQVHQSGAPYDVAKHLQGIEAAAKNRQAMRDQV